MGGMEKAAIAGVAVSRVGLGSWGMGGVDGGRIPDDVAVETCLSALRQGVNLFDTSPIYGDGRSEEIIGKAMRAHGCRDAFYIATKCGLERREGGVFSNSTAARIRCELEGSLRRLSTDYIDLYQVHWPDPLVPIAEVAGLLAQFQREGKVRALGASNFTVAEMEEFRAVAPLASDQAPYNLFDRQIDCPGEDGRSIRCWSRANGVALLCYSPLCRSLLAGRVARGMRFDGKDIRSFDPRFQEPLFNQYMTAVERLTRLAREHYGKAVLQLALRWLLDQPGMISVVLWGAKKAAQLDPIGGIFDWNIDAADMAEIDRIVAQSVTDPTGCDYLRPRMRQQC